MSAPVCPKCGAGVFAWPALSGTFVQLDAAYQRRYVLLSGPDGEQYAVERDTFSVHVCPDAAKECAR